MSILPRSTDDSSNKLKTEDTSSVKRRASRVCFFSLVLFIAWRLTPDALPGYALDAVQQQKQQQQPQQPQGKRSLEEERLHILKDDIQKEIEQYKKLKKDIDDTQKSLDEKNQERMTKVVKMYESMPPEDAARKLEKLDEETAVDILSSLKPKSAGRILAQMDNEKAANLSRKIIFKGKPN